MKGQRTFQMLSIERSACAAPPLTRALARREAHAIAREAASPETTWKYEALKQVKDVLHQYLHGLGVGAEFQASDFTAYLDARNMAPDELDLRCTGHLFRSLVRAGALDQVGFRANAGVRERHYHSTPRTVYQVRRIPERSQL